MRRGPAINVKVATALVRAVMIDRGVGEAVLDPRRAVEVAEVDANAYEILTEALAA